MESYARGQTTITYEIEGDGHPILLSLPEECAPQITSGTICHGTHEKNFKINLS